MKMFLLTLAVMIAILTFPSISICQAKHQNQLRDIIHGTPLDLWAGQPGKPYTVIKDIEAGGPTDQGMYDYVRIVLNNLMKQAIGLGSDAIINLKCGGTNYPNDHGDLFETQPWIAMAAGSIHCKGTAVKYSSK